MRRYFCIFFLFLTYQADAQEVMGASSFDNQFDTLKNDHLKKYTFLPQLKAISLSPDSNIKLSFGGEFREQLQVFNNENWGTDLIPGESNSGRVFILHRLMLYSNLDLTKYFRLFGELNNNLEANRKTGPRPGIDEDQLDVHQLFGDIMVYPTADSKLTFRAGRQEMNYGASRLISTNDGLNNRLSFQGYRVIFKRKSLQIDGFYVNPVTANPHVFDDSSDKSQRLYGFYATEALPAKSLGKIDAYYYASKNDTAVYYSGTGMEKRNTFGVRWYSNVKRPFNFDAEYVLQTGSFAAKKIRAYMAVLVLSYGFQDQNLNPSVSLVGQIASGNSGKSNELNTFNPLYARDYYGVGMPYWSSNLIQFSPVFKIEPSAKLSIAADLRAIWRASDQDGLYFPGGLSRSPFITGSEVFSTKSFVGYQYDFNISFSPLGYLNLVANISGLPSTEYIKQTGSSGNIFFANLQVRLRF